MLPVAPKSFGTKIQILAAHHVLSLFSKTQPQTHIPLFLSWMTCKEVFYGQNTVCSIPWPTPISISFKHLDALEKLPATAASLTTESVFKTPRNLPPSSFASRTMRRTSPLCKCGRRARQCIVGSPGPNAGRSFFACPKGRKSGCKYFVWDDASQASPVSTRPRVTVRDANVLSPDVVVTKVVTEEESLVGSCGTTAARGGRTKEVEENTVSVGSTAAAVAGPLSAPSSMLKPKKQYFGNVRIFNVSKSSKSQRL